MIRDYAAYIASFTEEGMEAELVNLQNQAATLPQKLESSDEIDLLFRLMHSLNAVQRQEEAAKIFKRLEHDIRHFRELQPKNEDGLEYFYAWSTMAMQLTPESKKAFVSLPLYRELFKIFDEGPDRLRIHGLQARVQLHRHHLIWLNMGGNDEELAADDLAFIQNCLDDFESRWEEMLDSALDQHDYGMVVKLYRNSANYYLQLNKPNDAIQSLKEVIEYLPDAPEFHEAMRAEVLMQIGQLFMSYKKFEVAARYFSQAHEIYAEGGEEMEMLAYQADAWLQDAKNQKS